MWWTRRVVTARELVVLSGSFTSHSKSVRRLRHFTWSCEPREIHSLQCWRAGTKSPQAYPARTGNWTRGRRVTGAHATTCAILHPIELKHSLTHVAITCLGILVVPGNPGGDSRESWWWLQGILVATPGNPGGDSRESWWWLQGILVVTPGNPGGDSRESWWWLQGILVVTPGNPGGDSRESWWWLQGILVVTPGNPGGDSRESWWWLQGILVVTPGNPGGDSRES